MSDKKAEDAALAQLKMRMQSRVIMVAPNKSNEVSNIGQGNVDVGASISTSTNSSNFQNSSNIHVHNNSTSTSTSSSNINIHDNIFAPNFASSSSSLKTKDLSKVLAIQKHTASLRYDQYTQTNEVESLLCRSCCFIKKSDEKKAREPPRGSSDEEMKEWAFKQAIMDVQVSCNDFFYLSHCFLIYRCVFVHVNTFSNFVPPHVLFLRTAENAFSVAPWKTLH